MNSLLMKKRATMRSRFLTAACLAAISLTTLPAMANSFRLQTGTVVLDERDGRSDFNVTNTGDEPILLLTKVDDLEGEAMAKNILVTPTVTRIDPGQSQIVHFTLKKGVTLDREYLMKASFEGVTQKVEKGSRLAIRQDIGFIAQPKSVGVEENPWKALQIQANGNQITLTNPSKHIVRLGPVVTLQPSGTELTLEHPYIMPGKSLSVSHDNVASTHQISITPLSRYGFVQTSTVLDIAR